MQKRKRRGLPKISVGYLLSLGLVNLFCNPLNPSSCRGVRYHWNLHDLLQTKVLMQPFVYCLCKAKGGHFFLCSLEARGSYWVSYPALLPIQHFDRHGLVLIQTPLSWMCQRNGALGSMAWKPSKVRVEGTTSLIWCHINAKRAGYVLFQPQWIVQGIIHIQIKTTLWLCPGPCAAHLCCFIQWILFTFYSIFQHVGRPIVVCTYFRNTTY